VHSRQFPPRAHPWTRHVADDVLHPLGLEHVVGHHRQRRDAGRSGDRRVRQSVYKFLPQTVIGKFEERVEDRKKDCSRKKENFQYGRKTG